MWRLVLASTVLCVGLAPSAVLAEGEPSSLKYTPPEPPPPPPELGSLLLRLAGVTLVVLLICGGLAWATRAVRAGAPAPVDGAGGLTYLGGAKLDARSEIHLVRVGSSKVVVAEDATGLRSLERLPGKFEQALRRAETGPIT